MYQDAVGELYYTDYHTAFPEFVVAAVDPAEPDRIVARALSVPFTWEGDPDADLPVDGWDGVLRRSGLVTATSSGRNIWYQAQQLNTPDLAAASRFFAAVFDWARNRSPRRTTWSRPRETPAASTPGCCRRGTGHPGWCR